MSKTGATVIIRVLQSFAGKTFSGNKGQVVRVSKEVGEDLIKADLAKAPTAATLKAFAEIEKKAAEEAKAREEELKARAAVRAKIKAEAEANTKKANRKKKKKQYQRKLQKEKPVKN